MTAFVYFAHPVDFADTRTVVNEIARQIKNAELALYDPELAWTLPQSAEPVATLTNVNRAVLSQCDAVIAYLPSGTRTVGVPREIEQAVAEGKPLLIVSDADTFRHSWALPQEDANVRHVDSFSPNQLPGGLGWLNGRVRHLRVQRHRTPPAQAMYVRLDPGAAIPTRAYQGDAGFDMYTTEETTIPAGGFVDVPVGIAIQFPERVWGMIVGRSSTVRRLDLLVTPGVIDTGYRGPLYAGVRSLRSDDYIVKKGERLAQIIPFPNVAMGLHATPVDVLSPTDRGEAGFGSSGA